MAIRDAKGKVDDKIPVKNVLISVYDKSGLEVLIPGLTDLCPGVRFISTGGTHTKVAEILGNPGEDQLIDVAAYTGFAETDGGLVKTLHPKIHLGILGERDNPKHQDSLAQMGGTFIDMVVVNLYPFKDVIAKPDVTFETARGYIDIGGPTMLRAAAKNFLGCAAVCIPSDYQHVLAKIKQHGGATNFNLRVNLAAQVFEVTTEYDQAIADYFEEETALSRTAMKTAYGLEGGRD